MSVSKRNLPSLPISRKAPRIPLIVNRRANYIERIEQVRFSDSSGNEYSYEMSRSGFNVLAVASRNGNVQMGYEREHSIDGFNLRHRQDLGKKAAEIAVALLDATAAKGGKMRAVLDPELAGVFAHEAVGHASEGDLIQEGNSVLKGRTGERIGNETLTIVDDPGLHEFGFDPVDAEGVAVTRTEIIRRGVINAFLHSRESLAAVGNGIAGHARAMPGRTPSRPDEQHVHRIRRFDHGRDLCGMQTGDLSQRLPRRAGRSGTGHLPVQCGVRVPRGKRGVHEDGPGRLPLGRDPHDPSRDRPLRERPDHESRVLRERRAERTGERRGSSYSPERCGGGWQWRGLSS